MMVLWLLIGFVLGAAGAYFYLKVFPSLKDVYKDGFPK